MPVRIAVDRDKCQGHGMCVMHAPDSFVIDPDTGVAEVVPGGGARSSLEALELTEQMCPVHAITILVDGDK